MLSEAKFLHVLRDLNHFGTEGHERLIVRRGVLRTKSRGSWIDRLIQFFYKPNTERLESVATFALHFFKENQEHLIDTKVLERLLPTLRKAKCGSKFENFITQINQEAMDRVEPNTYEVIEVDEEPVLDQNHFREKILRDYLHKEALTAALDFEHVTDRIYMMARVAAKKIDEDPEENLRLEIEALAMAREIDDRSKRERSLGRIANKQAKRDVAEALVTAREITWPHTREEALAKITAIQAREDIAGAFETARGITGAHHRVEALAKIAEEQSKSDITAALETLREALRSARTLEFGTIKRGEAFLLIVKIQAKENIEEALETTLEIHEDNSQAEALALIASMQEEVDMTSALVTARAIHNEYCRSIGLSRISYLQAKSDVEKAFVIAREIQDDLIREGAFIRIAAIQAKEDLTGALATARGNMHRIGNSGLSEIAIEQAKSDIQGALELASEIQCEYSRVRALSQIAAEQAKHDLAGAIETARGIPMDFYKVRTFIKIAKNI